MQKAMGMCCLCVFNYLVVFPYPFSFPADLHTHTHFTKIHLHQLPFCLEFTNLLMISFRKFQNFGHSHCQFGVTLVETDTKLTCHFWESDTKLTPVVCHFGVSFDTLFISLFKK